MAESQQSPPEVNEAGPQLAVAAAPVDPDLTESAPGGPGAEEPVRVVGPSRRARNVVDLARPFGWGFTATIGALVALALSQSLAALGTVLISVGVALFVALALDPLVRWLESRGLRRGLSILVVFAAFALVIGGILAIVVPMAVVQISQFASAVPGYVADLQNAEWFRNVVAATGQSDVFAGLLDQAQQWLSNPANLLTIGGGALAVGVGLVNGISGTLIVLVLSLYFLASLASIKAGLTRLAPAHARAEFGEITEQVTDSVGGYVSGMAVLALCNAAFAFILLSLLGVPFAALLALLALFMTMIPMVGPVLFWLLATAITAFTSWVVALIFAVVYFAYMQVEAYVMTPRVMNRAVDIPGSFVLIGAMVGATLLGLLGALIAVPVTASLLMIVNRVFIPRQDAKLVPDA